MCQPGSTQGYRQITNPVVSSEHLPVFHLRLMGIVNESIIRNDENERLCLYFSPEAEKRWLEFYNKVESEMGILGALSNFKDYASKMAENMARIAALLHYFNGDEGDISLLTTEAAVEISAWYVDEYIRLVSHPRDLHWLIQKRMNFTSGLKSIAVGALYPTSGKTLYCNMDPVGFEIVIK